MADDKAGAEFMALLKAVSATLEVAGGPAFPSGLPGHVEEGSTGMSLRDYFAAKALQGLLHAWAERITSGEFPFVAEQAYLMADAMLQERRKLAAPGVTRFEDRT